MKRTLRQIAAAFACGVTLAAAAAGQEASAAADAGAIDPAAIGALTAMGAYLRSLDAFQVTVTTTDEDVLDDGQKIQYDGVTDLLVDKPDKLRASVVDSRRDRLWLYDGRSLTLYGRRVNYYATVAAPPTLVELVGKLEEEHGLSLPLVDLFRWGAPGYEATGITAAIDVGPAAIGGVSCEHYAFRQADLDWQVWIQRGAFPLPRKLVITTRTDEARPQHAAVYSWNLAPSFSEGTFTFVPPAGAGRVVLTSVE